MARGGTFDLGKAGTITALLGPTNTGKTHLAVQRMLGHRTGMIGLPLRLLAREVYDRVVQAKGEDQVALVTGEEKRVPPGARYWVCTVESMPVDKPVAFLAVDEIQLAADPARGHVFTDRLLHARGAAETWFLGADTMAPMLARLVPTAVVRTQPRLSRLSYAGSRKLIALPRRSAVVAFSAREVYAIADRLRARHGGAAVVMGALSPRTRNAQVELFQSGGVHHLVATDAIGMGLNMDVHHVALAGAGKFDGRSYRDLGADELAQIAGRAGRWRRDGTFGETAGLEPLDPELVDAITRHRFAPIRHVYWRAHERDVSSGEALLASLQEAPTRHGLIGVRDAPDEAVLSRMLQIPEVTRRLTGPDQVRRLWEVCGIPDFGHVLPEHHAQLLAQIFAFISDGHGVLPEAWVARHVARLDRTDGDIATLMARIAAIRTWTFLANRGTWLEDAAAWRGRTRAIEDGISDALHIQLTARFVDRRAAWVVSQQGGDETVPPVLERDGTVRVAGEVLGALRGLTFHVEPGATLSAPALRAVRALVTPWVQERLAMLLASPDGAFGVSAEGVVHWDRQPVAWLVKGEGWTRPRVKLMRHDGVEGQDRGRVAARIEQWRRAWLASRLDPVGVLRGSGHAASGLVHVLAQAGGAVPRRDVADLLRNLTAEDRAVLTSRGVVLGRWWVLHPAAVENVRDRRALWSVWAGTAPDLPEDGGVAPFQASWPAEVARVLAFERVGPWLVRADTLEAVERLGQDEAEARGITPRVRAAVARVLHGASRGKPVRPGRIRGKRSNRREKT